MAKPLNVGGQAVLEGVMMRSPNSLAVAVRRKNGDIVVREAPWVSLWDKLRFLRWPFLRGAVVLIESLHNGISALSFSASQAAEDEAERSAAENGADDGEKPPELSKTALTLTLVFSVALGIGFFVVLPHFLTWLLGILTGVESLSDGKSAAFHAVDGVIKAAFFVAYVWAISKIPDIKRVFQYHGAEHMAIKTHEAGDELTVENARKHNTLHPRCGTSFLFIVILAAMVFFALTLPWVPAFVEANWLNQLILVGIKIPMMFPIAGLAYEAQKLSAKTYGKHPLVRALIWPGLMLQRITTQPPTDDQLEIGLVSVRMVLAREAAGEALPADASEEHRRYASFDELVQSLAESPEAA